MRDDLSVLKQFVEREADVLGDLTKQDRGDVAALMKRNCRAAAGSVAELFVRAALANFGEAELEENGYDFIGFEDGNIAHDSGYGNVLNSDKLGLKLGFAVFEKHFNNVVQVSIDLIQRFALGMGAGEAGHETYEQARLRAPLDYRRIDLHDWLLNRIGWQIMLPRSA